MLPLILTGKKTATWRLDDDKDLQEGDVVEFVRADKLEVFARAKLTRVIEKPFGELTDEEKEGHEEYESEEELFKTFSGYYDRPVDKETVFKIAKYQLLE